MRNKKVGKCACVWHLLLILREKSHIMSLSVLCFSGNTVAMIEGGCNGGGRQ